MVPLDNSEESQVTVISPSGVLSFHKNPRIAITRIGLEQYMVQLRKICTAVLK